MNPMLGIGSGLDLSTMLNNLVKVASEPKVQQLGRKEAEAKEAVSGLGALKSLLSDFQTASDALKDSSLFGKRSADVTQPSSGDVMTVSADESAQPATYDVVVKELAQGTSLATVAINTDSDAALTFSGTADANGVKDTLRFFLEVDPSVHSSTVQSDPAPFEIDLKDGMSMNDIVNAVNEHEDNFGVTASIIDGKLVYESSVVGDEYNLEVNSTQNNGNRIYGAGRILTGWANAPTGVEYDRGTVMQEAKSAEIELNGLTIKRDTNTLDDIVAGVTFNLTEVSTESAKVVIAEDKASVKTKIEAFATAYNKLREGMNELKGSYDEDTGEFTYGKLTGDPILRNIEGVLGTVLTQQVSGAALGADSLYAVGLEIESDGTFNIDSGRLDKALSDNFDSLSDLFSGAGGIATQTSERLDSFLGFTGVIKGKEDSYNDILKDLEEQYEAHTRYIESYQKTLIKQFTALDSTVGRLQSTMSQVGPQLAALANVQYTSSS